MEKRTLFWLVTGIVASLVLVISLAMGEMRNCRAAQAMFHGGRQDLAPLAGACQVFCARHPASVDCN